MNMFALLDMDPGVDLVLVPSHKKNKKQTKNYPNSIKI